MYSPAFGQNNYYIGFENKSDELFFKGDTDYYKILPTNEGNGKYALKMGPISPGHPSSVSSCVVCGGSGKIDFKWKQGSTITDLAFYINGSLKGKIPSSNSDCLSPSGTYDIDDGPHLLTWVYEFTPNSGIALPDEALKATCWIDDIHFVGLQFCNQGVLAKPKPEKPLVVGPETTKVGILCTYVALSESSYNTIRYIFDWGDGSRNNETDLNHSGKSAIISHIWDRPGIYRLVVTAKDNCNASSIPSNKTIDVSWRESPVSYPGKDLNNIINISKYTIFSLAEGFYDKSIYIGHAVNNITIKSDRYSAIDSLNGDYCIRIYNATNITIEYLTLRKGNKSIIIEKSKDVKILRNNIIDFKICGICIIDSSGIVIDNNTFNSKDGTVGVIIQQSNATYPDKIISKNNKISSNKICVSSRYSQGNDLYIDKNCRNFRENEIECTLNDNQFFYCFDKFNNKFIYDYNNISQYFDNFYKENKRDRFYG